MSQFIYLLYLHFISHITVIPRNYTFLENRKKQISLWNIILQNDFLAPE